MPAARRELFVPANLSVVVGVDIDKPRRHKFARCINVLFGVADFIAFATAYLHDHPVLNTNGTVKGRGACTVNDLRISDFEIQHGGVLYQSGSRERLRKYHAFG